MEELLAGLEGVLVFLDDILIGGQNDKKMSLASRQC